MVGCTFTTCLSDQQDEYLKQKEKQILNMKSNQTLVTQSSSSNTQTSSTNAPNITNTPGTSSSNNNNNTNSSSTTAVLTRTNFNLRGHKTDVI